MNINLTPRLKMQLLKQIPLYQVFNGRRAVIIYYSCVLILNNAFLFYLLYKVCPEKYYFLKQMSVIFLNCVRYSYTCNSTFSK